MIMVIIVSLVLVISIAVHIWSVYEVKNLYTRLENQKEHTYLLIDQLNQAYELGIRLGKDGQIYYKENKNG